MIPIELQTQGLLLTFILSLIMLGIYVLVHLFSYILQDNSLRAKAKNEYGQVIMNILFFFLIVVIAIPIIDNDIIPSGIVELDPYASIHTTPNHDLTSPPYNLTMREIGVALDADGNCLYSKKGFEDLNRSYAPQICVSLSFLDRLEWLTTETIGQIVLFYNQLGMLSTFTLRVQGFAIIPAPPYVAMPTFFQSTPGAGIATEMGVIAEGYKFLSHSLIITIMQKNAVDIVGQVLFPILLISGFVFRSFIFTRKFGGFLIAAALAMYYVAPLPYIIGHKALFESGNFIGLQPTSTGGYKIMPYADLMSDSDTRLLPEANIDDIDVNFLNDPIKNLMKLASSMKKYYNEIFSMGNAYMNSQMGGKGLVIEIDGLLHMIAKIAMLTVIIPLLSLFALLASIKAMAPFFGGDASIAGLTHFL